MDEIRKEKASAEQVTELIMSKIDKLRKEHHRFCLTKCSICKKLVERVFFENSLLLSLFYICCMLRGIHQIIYRILGVNGLRRNTYVGRIKSSRSEKL
jgi:hypothetical protein